MTSSVASYSTTLNRWFSREYIHPSRALHSMPLRQPLRRAHLLVPTSQQPLRNRRTQYPSRIATAPRNAIAHAASISAAKLVLAIVAHGTPMHNRPWREGAMVAIRVPTAVEVGCTLLGVWFGRLHHGRKARRCLLRRAFLASRRGAERPVGDEGRCRHLRSRRRGFSGSKGVL